MSQVGQYFAPESSVMSKWLNSSGTSPRISSKIRLRGIMPGSVAIVTPIAPIVAKKKYRLNTGSAGVTVYQRN
jgi:hypothetical protein